MAAQKKGAAANKPAQQEQSKARTPVQRWAQSTPNAIEELCAYISNGGHLNAFCKEHGFAWSSLDYWIHDDERRAEMYARARETRADKLADEIVQIADEVEVSAQYQGEEVTLALDSTAVARNKLRVDARKWVAAKLKPRTYGDKTTTEVTGKDGGAVQHAVAIRFVDADGRDRKGE